MMDVGEIQAGDSLDRKRDRETYTFRFRHESYRGKIYEGVFTNRILTPNQQLQVERKAASLRGGLPVESFRFDRRGMSEMLAWLDVSMPQDCRPDEPWAKDLGSIPDDRVVSKLYEEAMAHEDIFRGRDTDQKESKS